jgi:hypothetical protein
MFILHLVKKIVKYLLISTGLSADMSWCRFALAFEADTLIITPPINAIIKFSETFQLIM